MPTSESRITGCLLGGALGDALGAPVEFEDLTTIRERFGPAGVTHLAPAYGRVGAITDDTQMTLFTAEGLIRGHNRWVDRGIAGTEGVFRRSYQRWLVTQTGRPEYDVDMGDVSTGWLIGNEFLHARRAPGTTCLAALDGGDRNRTNDSKGCGGVMRVAPIGLVVADPFEMAVTAARITHHHPTGYLAAGAFAGMIAGLVRGGPLAEVTSEAIDRLSGTDDGDETAAALRGALQAAESLPVCAETVESLGEGWTAEEALAIGVYAVLVSGGDVRGGLTLAVTHSGDSDSTGSIAGNLLGAMFGEEALPADLLADLEGAGVIRQVGVDLVRHYLTDAEPDWDHYPPN